MRSRGTRFVGLLLMGLLLAGCAESAHQTGLGQLGNRVSEDVRRLVDESITFQDVKAAPESYGGKMVMFGGEVIRARRLKDQTEVEILQLPLGSDGIPIDDRSQSQGRFLAVEGGFLDPATVPQGTPLTVVGTVEGERVRPLSEGEDPYAYPVLRIVQLLNWQTLPSSNQVGAWPYHYNPYAYYGPSYWGPSYYTSPFWYPWGYGGYWGYGRGYPGSGAPSGGLPSGGSSGSPPPQFRGSGASSLGGGSGSSGGSIPPQFQKRLRD